MTSHVLTSSLSFLVELIFNNSLLQLFTTVTSGAESHPFLGADCPYDKLDAVREQQEELMRLHFELDNKMQSTTGPISGRNRQQARRCVGVYINCFNNL